MFIYISNNAISPLWYRVQYQTFIGAFITRNSMSLHILCYQIQTDFQVFFLLQLQAKKAKNLKWLLLLWARKPVFIFQDVHVWKFYIRLGNLEMYIFGTVWIQYTFQKPVFSYLPDMLVKDKINIVFFIIPFIVYEFGSYRWVPCLMKSTITHGHHAMVWHRKT